MEREITVETNGRLRDVLVVGFEGRVDQRSTPARKAPIFADPDGYLLRLRGPAAESTAGERTVRAFTSPTASPSSEPLPGVATRIVAVDAYLHDLVVVLGLPELQSAPPLGRLAQVLASLRADGSNSAIRDWGTVRCSQIGQDLAAWVCQPNDASGLWEELEQAHMRTLRRYAEQGIPELRLAAWRLSRAAASDGARWLAIAALERTGTGGADEAATLREALFRGWSVERCEAALEAARRQLVRA